VKPKVAISIGDLNGVGVQIALESHDEVSKLCEPVYCISKKMLQKAERLLNVDVDIDTLSLAEVGGDFDIKPASISKKSGEYSFKSFKKAIKLAESKQVDAITTMPIHKKAWERAGVKYKGHTDALRDYFDKDAIMMLGCDKMYVGLYTEHIPLKDVPATIKTKKIKSFLRDFYQETKAKKIAVLGLNPHAGDNGVLGNEEIKIQKAIDSVNKELKKEIFRGCMVPDIVFTPAFRDEYNYFVAMYHDQGLAPLKALYFDESINVSLNLPIVRTSVDHGTAFDIAYSEKKVNNLSYINAIKEAVRLSKQKI
jgi:4-hydroxythreonine-4-phosphate dehydrogenase